MKIFKNMKHIMYTAVTAVALAVVALSGVDAQAAISANPDETSKQVVTVGKSVELNNVTNLKINNKNYTKKKIKSKVKTTKTATYPRAYSNYASGYYTEAAMYGNDTAAQEAAATNFKYVKTYDFKLDFLTTGTYAVSYDKYENVDDSVTDANGNHFNNYNLKVTHHVDTYRVLQTTNPVKSIKLGKSSVTYTVKNKSAKSNTKAVVKNRYLTGASGNLTIKTNKNYSLTTGYVVTYDANHNVAVAPVANKGAVTYSTGNYKVDYKIPRDYDINTKQYTFTKLTGGESMYNETEIYYGYKDAFTGDYTNYAIGTRVVKVQREDAEGKKLYTTPAGAQTTEAYTVTADDVIDNTPIIDDVTATVITKSYPIIRFDTRTKAWAVVEEVDEIVVLPTAQFVGDNRRSAWVEVQKTDEDGVAYTEKIYQPQRNFETVSIGGVPETTEDFYKIFKTYGYDEATGNSIKSPFDYSLSEGGTTYGRVFEQK